MSLERWVRLISGIIVMVSLLFVVVFKTDVWLIITALAGMSLLQSGFTDWCPLMMFLRLLGIRQVCPLVFYERKIKELSHSDD
jgi:hypothetical protein